METFLYIKQQIDEVIKSLGYNFNNAITRATVENKIFNILKNYVYEGEIIDYTVICDERNNPPSVIENNDIVANITWTDKFKQKHNYEVNFQKIIKEQYEN